ncbi:hypothetical protein ABW20_dc0100816 [Dactylellina cionopaga]|nr:hypothetical protein ABW20_dc0100816 [Dactylellina cionopaga]
MNNTLPYGGVDEGPFVNSDHFGNAGLPVVPKPRTWTKWKLWVAGLVVALLVIVAALAGVLSRRSGDAHDAAVGGGADGSPSGDGTRIGTASTSQSQSQSQSQGQPTTFPPAPSKVLTISTASSASTVPTAESDSICHGRVCPSVLAVAQYGEPPTAFIFGIGHDSAIWYRETDGLQWVSDWSSLGGVMWSQPGAVSSDNGYVNVFAYSKNLTVVGKANRQGVWDTSWTELGGQTSSPITAITCSEQDIELAVKNPDGTTSRRWADNETWSGWEYHAGSLASNPTLGCTPFRIAHFGYSGTQNPLIIGDWYGSWTSWMTIGGDFRGDPVIASRTTEESLVFGISSNSTLQYYNWTKTGENTPVFQDLGGSFQSVPCLIVTSADRLDILVVGKDDRLKHRALIGFNWAPDWEDLGGAFNSTPIAVTIIPGKVSVYGLGVNGTLFHGTWSVAEGHNWQDGPNWVTDGGPLTLEYYRRSSI